LPTLLENYDLPAMSPNCVARSASMIAPQALHLMNNAVIDELADSMARRVQKEAGGDLQKQIERAYWIALSRPPTEEERKISLEAVRRIRDAEGKNVPAATTAAIKPAAGGTDPAAIERGDPARLALAELCHTLMNSAALLYID
jgi:uncharacterized protein DUF1553